MTRTEADPIVVQTAIKEMTEQFHRKLSFGHSWGPTSKGMSVIIEGHDISHLVRSVDINAPVGDVISVHLELINLEIE